MDAGKQTDNSKGLNRLKKAESSASNGDSQEITQFTSQNHQRLRSSRKLVPLEVGVKVDMSAKCVHPQNPSSCSPARALPFPNARKKTSSFSEEKIVENSNHTKKQRLSKCLRTECWDSALFPHLAQSYTFPKQSIGRSFSGQSDQPTGSILRFKHSGFP